MLGVGHILLVDDEPGIVAALRPALRAAGHTVTVATDGNAALGSLLAGDTDVILLDLGLPDMDGKDVIRAVRPGNRTPIIVISARHQEAEKVAALDLGADDYVDKPFVLDVLLARVRAALRRREGQVPAGLLQPQCEPGNRLKARPVKGGPSDAFNSFGASESFFFSNFDKGPDVPNNSK